MDLFDFERSLWKAWRRNNFFPTSAYEKAAFRGYQTTGKNIPEREVGRRLQSSKVWIFGDDRLISEDEEKIFSLLEKYGGKFDCLLTDRSRFNTSQKIIPWARSKKLTVRILNSVEDQIVDLSKKVQSIVVWTGALRLSPVHLPKFLERKKISFHAISLEAPFVRWTHKVDRGWIALTPSVSVSVERSPLWVFARWKAWNDRIVPIASPAALESTFDETSRMIAAKLKISSVGKRTKLLHPFNLKSLDKISNLKNPEARRFVWTQLFAGESGVVPQEKWMLLSTADPAHLAEEAAHHLRLREHKSREFGYHTMAVEEAFAFMASLWFGPRKLISSQRKSEPWIKSHEDGYRLGSRLCKAFRSSAKNRKLISKLWQEVVIDEKEAQTLWKKMLQVA